MKTIPRILSKVYCEPWLILPTNHRSIQQSLDAYLMDDDDGDEGSSGQPTQPQAPYELRDGGTAVIRVSGIIGKRLDWLETLCGGYDLDVLTAALDAADADYAVRRKVIDYNTPGGIATGVLEAGQKIAASSRIKPVISYTEMQCCSAGTWLATQGRMFYASASSQTGSIGAYAAYLDRSEQLAQMGVKVNAMAGGKYKLAGAPFRPMTDDERDLLQAKVTKLHGQFKAAVKSRRPDMMDEAMEGQVFDGEDAVDVGLVDALEPTLDDLLESLSGLY